ncbi:MAG: SDR family NAD(P)-dependent oxidoreductase [Methylococcaceae bacterium]|nr:SDR family NAD(P)-dependent oxidoreductase [Methylococcaceae bacterium]
MHTLKRTVLVTGASSGIGREVAKTLLNQGHKVIGLSRDCEQFEVQHEQFISFQVDLNDLNSLPKKAAELEQACPKIDCVVFAAGYGKFASLEEFSYPQIEAQMTVNFTSTVFLTRALLPKLKQKKRADLIYIGSEAALEGKRKGTMYCASKFALRGFTQALRDECAKSHVKVGLINPGMVKSEFFDGLTFEPGKQRWQHLLPTDVAAAVSYMLSTDKHIVLDEINLNPMTKVVNFKK